MRRPQYGNNGMQTVARTTLSGGESFLAQEPKGTLVYTAVDPVAALEVIDGEGVDRSETTFSLANALVQVYVNAVGADMKTFLPRSPRQSLLSFLHSFILPVPSPNPQHGPVSESIILLL